MILLVRHAVAVARRTWDDEDDLRPLNRRGLRQARQLADRLGSFGIEQVVTSPALRCRATVEPLAGIRRIEVETSRALREGKGNHALALVLDTVDDVVLCTHGDVIEDVLTGLADVGWTLPAVRPNAKGSTWLLTPRGSCRYIGPPC